MAYQFTDAAQNITLETNRTGEMVSRMCDGTNNFTDIVKEVFQEGYDLDDLANADLSSVEQINTLMDAFDTAPQIAGFIMKAWRLGALELRYNEKVDLLELPATRAATAILAEARSGGLTYERMRALMADEISFQLIGAKRRGEETNTARTGMRLLTEVQYLLESDALVPVMLAA